MKFILSIVFVVNLSISWAQESTKGNKHYKVRIAKCMKGTNFKQMSFGTITQTLRAMRCVIDTNSFLKSFIVSEGHPDCKKTLELLNPFVDKKPGEEADFMEMKRAVDNLKETECDLKDEYAKKMKKVAITYFEELEARTQIKRVSDEEKFLVESFVPKGEFNIYKANADSFILKYMQKGIEFKKPNDERTGSEELYNKLCKYQERLDKGEILIRFKETLISLLGPSEDKNQKVLKYEKHGLQFNFDEDGKLEGKFFLPDNVLSVCYGSSLKGRITKPSYLQDTLECYKTNANLALCDRKYCEKLLGKKISSSSLCQEIFDSAFLKRREVLGNDFEVLTKKTAPFAAKCIILNTYIKYCDDFINSNTSEQIEIRTNEINKGFKIVGLENEISLSLCRSLFDNKKILLEKVEEQRMCSRGGYRTTATSLSRE